MELMRKRSLREGFVFVGSGVMMYVKVMGNSTIVPDTLYFTVSFGFETSPSFQTDTKENTPKKGVFLKERKRSFFCLVRWL